MAEDELISVAAAAAAVGINRSTLGRQVKTGAIRSHNGRVRLTEVLEDRAANIDLTQSRRKGAAHSGAADATDAAPDATNPPPDATARDEELPPVLVDGIMLPFAEAQRVKENYLARLRRLEYDLKSKRLVDAVTVHRAVFDLARQERDALSNWPARIAPLIAAEIGTDQVALAIALEKHVRAFLAERSEPVLHFES